jgi:hypothetical protein
MKVILILALASFDCPAFATELVPDKAVKLGGQVVTLTELTCLPFVENEYSKLYNYDSFSNPKLKELRERYELEKVVASGKDEFDRQLLLMDWTHHRFKKFGRPSTPANGALEVLTAIDEGHSFFCSQYGQVMLATSASLGWVNRALALRRHQGVNKNGGSTEHTTTEIWSNQFGKWVMLDPTSNMYLEKGGVPLNAWEIRQEWFYNDAKDLVFVVGKERKRYKKSDLPVWLAKFDGFGDLTVDPDELDKYGFIGYIPNTKLTDAGFNYDGMFIVKDNLCDGTQWHTRKLPENPATDPYFPIGQATMSVAIENGKVMVALKTLTPNFKQFEIRSKGGEWKSAADKFEWKVREGVNKLEVQTVNLFGVEGTVSTAEITVKNP